MRTQKGVSDGTSDFPRTKPHVNIAAINGKLHSMGFTATAASEISAGRAPSFPGDRELLVRWFLELVDQAPAGRIS
jgi:hypothetical protein